MERSKPDSIVNHRVIAIAGPVGAGKSSLANALAKRLQDAAIMQFDSYEQLSAQSPTDLAKWLREGADFDAFAVPQLRNDLERLKFGATIVDPRRTAEIVPRKYILFEMPLGRAFTPTAELIDFLIWIDVPLDVALARKIREFTLHALGRNSSEAQRNFPVRLNSFLGNYLGFVHDVLTIQQIKVSAGADLIVDGRKSPEEQAAMAAEAIASALEP
jgi:uridine kinase